MGEGVEKLRFAVMVPGDFLKAWQLAAIRALLDGGHTEPVLIIRDERSSRAQAKSGKWKKYSGRNGIYHLYTRLFQRIPSMVNMAWDTLLKDVPLIDIMPETRGRFSEYFQAEDIERVRNLKPDIILRFGFNILRGEILDAATYGVWSYHHADEHVFRGGPAAFWEVFRRHDRIGVILQRLTADIDGGTVLKKGWYPVTKHAWNETMERVLSSSADWPARVCADIRAGTLNPFELKPSGIRAPMNRLPGNVVMLKFLFRTLISRIRFYIEKYFYTEDWNIGILVAEPGQVLKGNPLPEPQWLLSTSRSFFAADPCVFMAATEKRWIIYERFVHSKGRGVLHAVEWKKDGSAGTESLLLEKDYHLAYPRVFYWDGRPWLLAETSESGSQMVFRLDASGDELRLTDEKVLIPGLPAVDGTLHQHEGTWYFFYTLRSTGTNTCLHIQYADTLEGPWNPHPMNPVKTDISSARPGGPLFEHEGELYRPAQDSAVAYGTQVRIHKIIKLSQEDFSEEEVAVLAPGKGWKFRNGLHTLVADGTKQILDAKRRRFRVKL